MLGLSIHLPCIVRRLTFPPLILLRQWITIACSGPLRNASLPDLHFCFVNYVNGNEKELDGNEMWFLPFIYNTYKPQNSTQVKTHKFNLAEYLTCCAPEVTPLCTLVFTTGASLYLPSIPSPLPSSWFSYYFIHISLIPSLRPSSLFLLLSFLPSFLRSPSTRLSPSHLVSLTLISTT